MMLTCSDIEKAFGLGDGVFPESDEALLVMCLSFFEGGIDAIAAIRHVIGHPLSVSGILAQLGDDEIDGVVAAVAAESAVYHIAPTVFRSLDIMRAWITRQTVLKSMRTLVAAGRTA